uniref:Putative ovule protein n=1 Tax=Solanum chacoense TaxID=4108 RepID=A0A0V0HPT3_SOLCH
MQIFWLSSLSYIYCFSGFFSTIFVRLYRNETWALCARNKFLPFISENLPYSKTSGNSIQPQICNLVVHWQCRSIYFMSFF